MTTSPDLSAVYREQHRRLRSLAYRMIGDPAEADDVLHEAFVRAAVWPPADTSRPWGPWLTRVVVNLAIDTLRARQRRAYVGPWLPVPVVTEASTPEVQLETLEHVSYAFLCAAEQLSAKQRAVLILRDVCEYSSQEVAEMLEIGDADVRQSLTRARKAMGRVAVAGEPSEEAKEANRRALEGLVDALVQREPSKLVALLADDVRAQTDSGGEYRAAYQVVEGADAVAKLLLGITQKGPPVVELRWLELNGLPALWLRTSPRHVRDAPEVVVRIELVDDGTQRIGAVQTVSASAKVRQVVVDAESAESAT